MLKSCCCFPNRQAVDTTGAGDLFAAGFLYSLINGMDLRRCGEIGCMAGGAVVQTLVRGCTVHGQGQGQGQQAGLTMCVHRSAQQSNPKRRPVLAMPVTRPASVLFVCSPNSPGCGDGP